jgi:energy-converting hydrogenase B subunit D
VESSNLTLTLDIVVATALVGLAWTILVTRDLFKAVVLYIVFGLLMSVAWIRLEAPDIALAEAAIGAGLTGALLLSAIRQLQRGPDPGEQPNEVPCDER